MAHRIGRRGAIALGLAPLAARAQGFPDRPIKLIVPFPPGGPVDAAARIVAQALAPLLGQPVVIDNRSGAGGSVGIDALAKAAPDGFTLALGSTGAVAVNVSLIPNLSYDPRRDLVPVGMVAGVPSLLVVRPGLPVRDIAGLLALVRQKPGGLTFASTGPGGSPHLAAELLKLRAGLDIVHVAYRGAAPAITALLGNEVDMAFLDLSVLLPQVRDGALRPMALAAAERSPALPAVPTLAESGVAGVEVENWYAVMAPARVPAERLAVLSAALREAMAQPETAARFTAQGARVIGGTPAEAAAFIAAEIERWAEVVRRADIRPD
ncbi:MAG: Bug family tripartite tricarboxylate transporter substrate binding protein [Paracraurococcus sp.]